MTTDKGVKLDADKPRMELVLGGFSKGLFKVAEVGTFGAKKYTDNGWQEVDDGINRYTGALLRHLLSHLDGEIKDKESKLLHLSHVAWNALAILTLYLNSTIKKDA